MALLPIYKMPRLMTPGAGVDKVIFKELAVQDNQYALQVHMDLVNGLLNADVIPALQDAA